MLTLADVLAAHPNFCPSDGKLDDMPTNEEIWATNRITQAEYDAIWYEYEELERMRLAGDEMARVAEQNRELIERTKASGIPGRYQDVPLDVTYVDELGKGKGAFVFGVQGSGKTWRACAMLRGWMSKNQGRAFFVTSSRMLTEVSDTYNARRSTAEVLDMYGRCPMLVIDDIGKESPTDHALQRMWDVLNDRYSWGLPTVVTTQYDLNELVARMGRNGGIETAKAIVSRLYEDSIPIDMGRFDRRINAR